MKILVIVLSFAMLAGISRSGDQEKVTASRVIDDGSVAQALKEMVEDGGSCASQGLPGPTLDDRAGASDPPRTSARQ